MEVKIVNRISLDKLSIWIVLVIGCQQFPVIRVGGSFRLYEMLALFIFMLILAGHRMKIRTCDFSAVIFFMLAPILSALISLFLTDQSIMSAYYMRFPFVTDEFRYDQTVAVFFPTLYYFLSGISYLSISNAIIPLNMLHRYIKIFFLIASLIAINAIVTSVLNEFFGLRNLIQTLPEYMQNVGRMDYGFRASGLSQEPSFYVLYQGWVVLILWFYRKLVPRISFLILFVINVVALLLTSSSALAGLFLSIFVIVYLRIGGVKKIYYSVLLVSFSLLTYNLISESALYEYMYYFFFEKINNFFSIPTHTLDSGSYRSFTNLLGLFIFKDFWLFGVGPGGSIFYMPSYEYLVNIVTFGEKLNPGTFPQNSYSSVLAELGIFGFIPMLYLLLKTLFCFIKASKKSHELMAFSIGTLFTMFSLFSIAPAYSMFIWVFIAFGNLIIRQVNKNSI